jgi:hypothetical protein
LRKCTHGPVNEIFSGFEEEIALHFEISEIKLVRKANGRVQHLSPGPHPLAAFDLTAEGISEICIRTLDVAPQHSGMWILESRQQPKPF